MGNSNIGIERLPPELASAAASRQFNSSPWPRNRRLWHLVRVVKEHNAGNVIMEREGYSARFMKMVTPPRNRISRKQRANLAQFARPVSFALFPGYSFVEFDASEERWHEIFRFVGIYGILCAGGLPYPLPDDFIPRLRRLEQGGVIPLKTPLKDLPFKPGDVVQITRGAFIGHEATIEELADDERIRLLLGIFGGLSRIELTLSDIVK